MLSWMDEIYTKQWDLRKARIPSGEVAYLVIEGRHAIPGHVGS
jgi:hypothetical protein